MCRNVRACSGYDFTGFSDDRSGFHRRHRGWFLKPVGSYWRFCVVSGTDIVGYKRSKAKVRSGSVGGFRKWLAAKEVREPGAATRRSACHGVATRRAGGADRDVT